MLALRGLYRAPEDAEVALIAVREAALPEKPTERRPLRMWVRGVHRLLVFRALVAPPKDNSGGGDHPDETSRGRLRAATGIAIATAIW